MKLSTKGRYGVRLMIDLASQYGKGPIALKDIAKRQEISEKYLWHLISPLKHAGLINAVRGAFGGYVLAKSPKDINLKDIVSVVEGPICIVDCVDNASLCNRASKCAARDIWSYTAKQIQNVLAGFTLDKMVAKQKNKIKH